MLRASVDNLDEPSRQLLAEAAYYSKVQKDTKGVEASGIVKTEVKYHDKICFERKGSGQFKGVLASDGELVQIEGQSFVMSRIIARLAF